MILSRLTIRIKTVSACIRFHSNQSALKPPWKILFFGSDEFSLASFKKLYSEYRNGSRINGLEIVTSFKNKTNPLKRFAVAREIEVHDWPYCATEKPFDVGVVVSFGHLIPEDLIKSFPLGMLNVHASLLPRWRGAAPIIHTIANGDKRTGVTIMRIRPHKFDIGEIIKQVAIEIDDDIQMPELHARLAQLGADALLEVVGSMPESLLNAKEQPREGVTLAPRIKPEFSTVHWNKMTSVQVYNLARALKSLFPLQTRWNGNTIKLVDVCKAKDCSNVSFKDYRPGFVRYDKTRKVLKVLCNDNKWICVQTIGVGGKRLMSAEGFNNGYLNKQILEKRYFT